MAAPSVHRDSYGTLPDGRQAELFTLTNSRGMRVKLTNFGALTVGVEVPDRAGRVADVTLGFDSLEGWLVNKPHFGATCGRYANRIAKGRFTLDGKTYQLATNNGPNHLHGGIVGFDKILWDAAVIDDHPTAAGVSFTYRSRDGEEGYPGELHVETIFSLFDDNRFVIEFSASVMRKATVVNLAHHSYWNLSGAAAGDILDHELMIDADRYTPVDSGLIPTGELRSVEGTPLDFRQPTAVGARIAQLPTGYDHNFVLNRPADACDVDAVLAARVRDPKSGRVMEVLTNQPGIQFYSANFLDGTIAGKGGVVYRKHGALCLETQHFPDSPNHPEFPTTVLRPPAFDGTSWQRQKYYHVMIHKFTAT